MKIDFFEVTQIEQESFKKFFSGLDISFYEDKLTLENVNSFKDVEIVNVFTNSVVNKEIIDLLPNLKLINTSSTGYDHIDVKYCSEKGIKVSNVPAYGSVTVAEFTFALLLNLSRKVLQANEQLREDDNFKIFPLKGFDLKGKTLGVIGTGRIGKNVIKIANGFGMNVIACNKTEDKNLENELGFKYKNLDEIISESDIITLHVPYSEENFHLINKDRITKMKKGVFIINTARGELLDATSLLWGIKEGIVAGAGLDVLEGERELKEELRLLSNVKAEPLKNYKELLEGHILINMPQVIVTPHIAFYSKEAEEEIIKTTEDNIRSFIIGQPQNLLN